MRIFVQKVLGNEVLASTEFGSIRGKWCSDNPPMRKEYIVELDSKDPLSAQNCSIADFEMPSLGVEGERVHICGFCESCEDDVLFLRLGKYLMMLECSCNFDADTLIGCYIRVELSSLEIYDTGVL